MNNMAKKASDLYDEEAHQSLQAALDVLEKTGGSRNHLALIRGLVKSADLSKGLTYVEIADLLGIQIDGDRGYTKKIRNWFEKTVNQLEEHKLEIAHRLKEKDINRQPVLSIRKGSGSGNPSVLSVEMQDFEEADEALLAEGIASDEGHISYKVNNLSKLPMWAKPFSRLNLIGRRKYLYAFFPAIWVILGAVASIAILNSELTPTNKIIWHLYSAAAIYCVWSLIKPFYSLLDARISHAPFWMLPFKTLHALLVIRKINGHEFDREILLLEFTGKCPICGDKVEVVEGRGEFKGRFIGRCREAGAEHLYSFDHVSKIGVPLRSNGYYGQIVKEQKN